MPHTVYGPNGSLSHWIADQFPDGYQGHAIDVGASDGISISTTYVLEKDLGWTVLCVEPNPEFTTLLNRNRAWIERCACDATPGIKDFHIHEDVPEAYSSLRVSNHAKVKKAGEAWRTIKVKAQTVNDLLLKWEFPKLDALCIDVEGCEMDVLQGANVEKWRPRVIVLESWTPGALDVYLAGLNYQKAGRHVENDLYVRRSE